MPTNKVKKTKKRDEDLKELGLYPENPDETLDLSEEEVLEVYTPEEGDGEEEE